MRRHILTTIAAVALLVALGGCYEPSPLYGTWAASDGSTLMLLEDKSYTAKVYVTGGTLDQRAGTYDVLMNILVLTDETGSVMETEWDIRGNILYLTWQSGSENLLLTLYKIAN